MVVKFFITLEKIQLSDLNLESPTVHLNGDFGVNPEGMVASKLVLGLSQKLLAQSPRLAQILKIFPDDMPFLDFDFQLSGNIEAMNFQWLSSEIKQKIEQRIPNFIEHRIETQIDQSIHGEVAK